MTNEIKLKIVIDGKEANAALDLTDDNIKELYKSFKFGRQEVNGLTTAISQGFNNAREIFQGVRETFSILNQAFGSLVRSYNEQELNETKLQTALRQTGNYTEDVFNGFKSYASELQSVTLFGDEAYLSVFGLLQAMGLSVDETKQAAVQTANLAQLMGTDLQSAARVMGDLFGGDATMIKRYVKGLDDTILKSGDAAKIIEMLNQRIGGQAIEAAKTGAGGMVQLQNSFSDLQENAGLLISRGITPVVSAFSGFLSSLNNSHPIISGAIGVLGALSAAFVALRVTGITSAVSALTGMLIPAIKSVYETAVLWSLINPISASLIAVAALSAGIYALAISQKSDLEIKKELIETNLKDADIQKQKISNNIAQLKSENDLIDKAHQLYQKVNSTSEASGKRNEKEKELQNTLSNFTKIHPQLISSQNTLRENMALLDTARQKNIDKEKTYQAELANTILKLDELSNKKFFADFTLKVENQTKGASLLGVPLEGEDALTKEIKRVAFTGTIQQRTEGLEKLKQKSAEEILSLQGYDKKEIEYLIKARGESVLNSVKNTINPLLELLYNKQIENVSSISGKKNEETVPSGQDKQSELQNELKLKNKEGRERELEDLRQWYEVKKNIAKGNSNLLLELEQVYKTQQLNINKKYDKQYLEDQAKIKKENDQQLNSRIEGINQSITLFEKKKNITGEAGSLELRNIAAEINGLKKKTLTEEQYISLLESENKIKELQKPDTMKEVTVDLQKQNIALTETDERFKELAGTIGVEATVAGNKFVNNLSFGLLNLIDLTDAVKEGFQSAGRAVASAMGQSVRVFRQANSLLQIFINSLVEAVVQALAFKAAMAALNFLSGGVGGFFGSIFGGASTAIPAAASGAVVTKPTFMMVGEGREPEGVFPLSYLNGFSKQQNGVLSKQEVAVTFDPVELKQSGMDMRGVLKAVEKSIRNKR